MASQGRLIFVTGTPGTGVERALDTFIRWCSSTGLVERPPQVVKLENQLRALAAGDVRECLGVSSPDGTARLYDVLRLPKPVLYKRWRDAYRASLREAQPILNSGSDVFLTFHACWYHVGNREYISGVDFRSLTETDVRPGLVLTLIDDIYDVRSRLSAPFGVLEPSFAGSETIDVILKLLLILDWRAFEITLSERIAEAACEGGHFVLAVKHPIKTLYSLLFTKWRRIYLSHHITHPRRMLQRSEDQSEARLTIRAIQTLARDLRNSTVLFEPTAIDEARIEYHYTIPNSSSGRELTLPLLGERWPPAEDDVGELLYDPPANRLPELGRVWSKRAAEILANPSAAIPEAELAELEGASALLQVLADGIFKQINSRDHFLVEHTDGIVVYRPYFLGYEAGGVKEELDHHNRLLRAGISRSTAIVLHTPEDERLRPRRMGETCLTEWRIDQKIVGTPEALNSLVKDLASAEEFWAKLDGTDASISGRVLTEHLKLYNVQFRSTVSSSALGPDAVVREAEASERRGVDFLSRLAKNYLQQFQGRDDAAIIIEEELNAEKFAARVGGILGLPSTKDPNVTSN
jgi:hypothetical protein